MASAGIYYDNFADHPFNAYNPNLFYPDLGFDGLDEEVLRQYADPAAPEVFGPTEEWNEERAADRLWS